MDYACTKDEISNNITMKLAELIGDGAKIQDVKNVIFSTLYDYSVEKITSTEITTCDGSTTEYLLKVFTARKISQGCSQKSLYQYIKAAEQICDMHKKNLIC